MLTIFRYANGRRVDGLILAAKEDLIRVVFPDNHETAELTRAAGRWVSERGEMVEIEALISVSPEISGTYFLDLPSKLLRWNSGLSRSAGAVA
jgi:hypothetical protein